MSELVFLLEEPSAEAMLKGFLPKLLSQNTHCRYIVFEGKQDLEKNLVRRLRGYLVPNAKFVVLRDKDGGDCKILKKGLVEKCVEAGKPESLVRIACFELESWYLAQLAAVELGMSIGGLIKYQNKRLYVSPDDYPSPAQTLKHIVPSYQKISGSRAIGPYLDPDVIRSQSFAKFVTGLKRVLQNN
ncbi:MAG: DUF4276 family protein [Deltaproteobacteria bacterium]|nr:DUF4276 family protein [Deltaproteobacteria bacterium]